MKQLFDRQFFIQKPAPGTAGSDGGDVQYIRLHGHSMNPATVLHQQRIFLGAGGVLDVVSERHAGEGVGRISYTPGLKAAVKRGEQITYRFEVPSATPAGSTFTITAYGHDQVPPFNFVIEVGRKS